MTEPRWLKHARTWAGVREIPGPKHNDRIVEKRRKLGSWMLNDEDPWCGDFVAHCMQASGLPYPKTFYRALDWRTYGANLRPERVAPGAILVFGRSGGGHVGFYVGEDKTHYHVFGGNQSNAVNVARIAKDRLVAIRWPRGEAVIGAPVLMSSGGVPITTNER